MVRAHADKREVGGSIPLVPIIWSVGQGVKTPPFHGGNTGSNPVRTIDKLSPSGSFSLYLDKIVKIMTK